MLLLLYHLLEEQEIDLMPNLAAETEKRDRYRVERRRERLRKGDMIWGTEDREKTRQ